MTPRRDGLDRQAGQNVGRGVEHDDRSGPGQGPVEGGGRVDAPTWSMDLLVDAVCVVREHMPGRIDDGGWAPVVDGQRVRAGGGEVTGEVDEELGVAPA